MSPKTFVVLVLVMWALFYWADSLATAIDAQPVWYEREECKVIKLTGPYAPAGTPEFFIVYLYCDDDNEEIRIEKHIIDVQEMKQ